jgi:maltooligosyltrehalose trehalohydrolase
MDAQSAPDPQSDAAFTMSVLDLAERDGDGHAGILRLHRELLTLRREDPVFGEQSRLEARPAGERALLVCQEVDGLSRLSLVNLGSQGEFDLTELSARRVRWRPLLCTAEGRFDGPGVDLRMLQPSRQPLVTMPPQSAAVWSGE